MKRCLRCEGRHVADGWSCTRCGHSPGRLDGFLAFAPQLAYEEDAFPAAGFAAVMEVEERHCWFRARIDLILWLLRRHFPGFRSFLEVGCGTGFVLKQIEQMFPRAIVQGSDLCVAGLCRAAGRLRRTTLFQMDARRIPFRDEFAVIGSFDTLEHIAEDRLALAEMHAALEPGGGLIVSVPQHTWLWSAVDEYSRHVRRYTRRDLRRKLEQAGFLVQRMTSFVSCAVPLMLLQRRLAVRDPAAFDPTVDWRVGRVPNRMLALLLAAERRAIQAGMDWPFGGSLFAVARKPARPP